MSEVRTKREQALEKVAANLLRIRRMGNPHFTNLDAWKTLAATFERDLRDSEGSDLEHMLRTSLEICDERIVDLEAGRR